MSQPVLPLLPAQARSVGPSAGLLQGPDGGVVFVFGLATYTFGAGDETGRRLAAVQLQATRVATAVEVAAAFGVTTVTLWRWGQAFTDGGVAALVPERTGPKGPSKLTGQLAARIVELDRAGLSLRLIAEQTGVSTATVRVALGRVAARPSRTERRAAAAAGDAVPDLDVPADEGAADESTADEAAADEAAADGSTEHEGVPLVLLAAPVPRTTERAAARAGDLVEAPVVLTQGASVPLAGLLLVLPALEMTGLLQVADGVFGPMRKGFYALRATLLTLVLLALLRSPRAEGLTRLPPADLGRLLGLDRAPEVKTLRRKLAELAARGKGTELQAALGAHHAAGKLQGLLESISESTGTPASSTTR